MAMLGKSVFTQAGPSCGFTGRSIDLRPVQPRPGRRTARLNPPTGSTPGWEGPTGTPGFSNAAVHKDEPAATGSRSGGQT